MSLLAMGPLVEYMAFKQAILLGYNTGAGCQSRSNNTFLGSGTSMYGANYVEGSIALGSGATITGYNQLMVATNVTQFNIPGLAASTGTCAGTILEFDSAGNIFPMAGTYKTVSKIDTAIASINAPNYFWFTGPTLSGTEDNFTNRGQLHGSQGQS